MGSNWILEGWVYVNKAGQLIGPVSDDELKRLIASGEIGFTDRVWMRWKNGNQLSQPALARDVYHPRTSPY